MNISSSGLKPQQQITTKSFQPSTPTQAEAAPSESFTFSGSEGGSSPILRAVSGAALGFAGNELFGGSPWKMGLGAGVVRGASYYVKGRLIAHQAEKNGDIPGGLGAGIVMGRAGATIGFVSGVPAFTLGAWCANLCGGGPVAHAVAGAVAGLITP